MKCEVYLELLEEYLDGELAAAEQTQVSEHLMTCTDCSAAFGTLTAEQELFARYDREIEVPPFLWTRIAAQSVSENEQSVAWTSRFASLFAGRRAFAGAIAILLLAITVGVIYWNSRRAVSESTVAESNKQGPRPAPTADNKDETITPQSESKPNPIAANRKPKHKAGPKIDNVKLDHSDVLSSDLGYLDIDERDTANHLEQTQNLLRSIRNFQVSDSDEEIDVSYDKALSRRLLNENVVLRRDAEMKAKFPTKTLLADLEPFLIDIANLPDHARPEDVRAIKERVRKTEIVAALVEYQDRGTNNR